jgi:hypothetical protein
MYEDCASIPKNLAQHFIYCAEDRPRIFVKNPRLARRYMTRPIESKHKAFNVIETTSRSGLVERQLREYIMGSRLVPGHRLPSENELSGRLGVSRSAIREGLKALEAVGVITTHQGKGSFSQRRARLRAPTGHALKRHYYPPRQRKLRERFRFCGYCG